MHASPTAAPFAHNVSKTAVYTRRRRPHQHAWAAAPQAAQSAAAPRAAAPTRTRAHALVSLLQKWQPVVRSWQVLCWLAYWSCLGPRRGVNRCWEEKGVCRFPGCCEVVRFPPGPAAARGAAKCWPPLGPLCARDAQAPGSPPARSAAWNDARAARARALDARKAPSSAASGGGSTALGWAAPSRGSARRPSKSNRGSWPLRPTPRSPH